MSTIIDDIMQMPEAISLQRELTEKLEDERRRRQKFYEDVDDSQKAEFINGEIVLHSPAKHRHNMSSYNLMSYFSAYNNHNNLGVFVVEKGMVSLTRNDYEPDICFFLKETAKGFTGDMTHYPAPDFVVEILSKSTEHIDRKTKYRDYEQHGVKEYWIVDPANKMLEQYILENGNYKAKLKATEGKVDCDVLEGLSFDIEDIFKGI